MIMDLASDCYIAVLPILDNLNVIHRFSAEHLFVILGDGHQLLCIAHN